MSAGTGIAAVVPAASAAFIIQLHLIEALGIFGLGSTALTLGLRLVTRNVRPFRFHRARTGLFLVPTIDAWLLLLLPFLALLITSTITAKRVYGGGEWTLLAVDAWISVTMWIPLYLGVWLATWAVAVSAIAPRCEVQTTYQRSQALALNSIGVGFPLIWLVLVLPPLSIAQVHIRQAIDAPTTVGLINALHLYVHYVRIGDVIWAVCTFVLATCIVLASGVRIRRTRRQIQSLSSYRHGQYILDPAHLVPTSTSAAHIEPHIRALRLECVHLVVLTTGVLFFLGPLSYKACRELETVTKPISLQVIRLLLLWAYIVPGTARSVLLFIQSLPRHAASQETPSSEHQRAPLDEK